MRVHQQPAYILLNRPYSETSWIVEVFSRDYGRLALMAKGARRIKSKLKSVLIPFQPTLLSWTGKGEVPTLTSAEIDLTDYSLVDNELTGDALVCGFYCNELIVNLLHRHDPHSRLFDDYHHTLLSLAKHDEAAQLPETMREFEKKLMREIGYGISFQLEADGKTKISDDAFYRYQPQQGFVRLAKEQSGSIQGGAILAIDSDFSGTLSTQQRAQGKQLMRDILSFNMNRKKIISRELFYPKLRSS